MQTQTCVIAIPADSYSRKRRFYARGQNTLSNRLKLATVANRDFFCTPPRCISQQQFESGSGYTGNLRRRPETRLPPSSPTRVIDQLPNHQKPDIAKALTQERVDCKSSLQNLLLIVHEYNSGIHETTDLAECHHPGDG